MKAKSRISSGFTLIELLVVIVVIGLLAAIIIPSLTASLRAAKRARALSQIQDLDGAIKRFIAEYGIPPRPKGVAIGDADMSLTVDQQAQVIQILMNLDDWPGEKRNTKQMVFLALDPASFDVNTAVEMQAALLSGGYPDPWGTPYGILLDMNMDDRIVGTGFPDIRGKVGVFSYGEDEDVPVDDPPYKTW
ncbi:MAG: prepilin-type N-terminal cleavage/methylation domain-containing protein [Kiritimatiellae bacterium]|nr:prepilin-type N-terminal cleavage/methylation domain-containing protein [Kiritimatiellia bacterium]MDD4342442.1 prepilin-type N-terminal cleavage/methylation domain-containing protein [Kiritimatiellia bacterium]